MKRIIFILISAAIFFISCLNVHHKSPESLSKTAAPAQIAADKEFGGVEFGMTKEEVIDNVGRQPDNEVDEAIWYYEDVYFHERYGSKPKTAYSFDDNDILCSITCYYNYALDGSEQEQIKADYAAIKKELFERYPIEICTDFHENEEDAKMTLDTKNRHVLVFYSDFYIIVSIDNVDNTEASDSPKS